MIYVSGPGHGGPALVGNAWLEGTYSEIYPHVGQDRDGLNGCSGNFHFPEAYPAMYRPSVPAPFTKAANWAIH